MTMGWARLRFVVITWKSMPSLLQIPEAERLVHGPAG
jgi:hypothetical protein